MKYLKHHDVISGDGKRIVYSFSANELELQLILGLVSKFLKFLPNTSELMPTKNRAQVIRHGINAMFKEAKIKSKEPKGL